MSSQDVSREQQEPSILSSLESGLEFTRKNFDNPAFVVVKIYPPLYPLWRIAFACIFGYTESVEVLLISAPQTRVAISRGHV